MINDVYNAKILEFAGNISRIGRLEKPSASVKLSSKLCGSTIIVDVKVEKSIVTDYAHEVKACALGQAASSIIARVIVGSTIEEIQQLQQDLRHMLENDGPPPIGKFEDFKYLQPVKDYKARHASTLLSANATAQALSQCSGL